MPRQRLVQKMNRFRALVWLCVHYHTVLITVLITLLVAHQGVSCMTWRNLVQFGCDLGQLLQTREHDAGQATSVRRVSSMVLRSWVRRQSTHSSASARIVSNKRAAVTWLRLLRTVTLFGRLCSNHKMVLRVS